MGFFRAPAPFQNVDTVSLTAAVPHGAQYLNTQLSSTGSVAWDAPVAAMTAGMSLGHLMLLVFEAVMEVVCVSLPGYIIARIGHFDAENQKFIANLNVMLFTPCLVFTKLASQLNAENISELAIIPVIFILMTAVSWACGKLISKIFRFRKRQANFVTAMSVFGNSNSLPISLVLSLSKTLEGLHWDRIPNDTDEEVAARGILYLLIFQQLGQLLRWSWGYRVLLAPKEFYAESEDGDGGAISSVSRLEAGYEPSNDDLTHSQESTTINDSLLDDNESHRAISSRGSRFPSGSQTPVVAHQVSFSKFPRNSVDDSRPSTSETREDTPLLVPQDAAFMPRRDSCGVILRFPSVESRTPSEHELSSSQRFCMRVALTWSRFCSWTKEKCTAGFKKLPSPVRTGTGMIYNGTKRFILGFWDFMNPPLWSMGIAILVASVPSLQNLFFTRGTFINNSVTRAVEQTGSVAVPLILVVLGANLARNTLPELEPGEFEHPKEERNLIIASLLGRMLLPTLVTAPVIALMAKYLPISILDDPIFVVVCFLLAGAPSALQLAQICQINN
ncbi:hypothetical protein KEM56_007057, partial [Ascosphaera pollenicola]